MSKQKKNSIAARFLSVGDEPKDLVFRVSSIDTGEVTLWLPGIGTVFLSPRQAGVLCDALASEIIAEAELLIDLAGDR